VVKDEGEANIEISLGTDGREEPKNRGQEDVEEDLDIYDAD